MQNQSERDGSTTRPPLPPPEIQVQRNRNLSSDDIVETVAAKMNFWGGRGGGFSFRKLVLLKKP